MSSTSRSPLAAWSVLPAMLASPTAPDPLVVGLVVLCVVLTLALLRAVRSPAARPGAAGEVRSSESDDLLRELAQSVRAVLWLREAESGRIVYLSPSFRDVWGRDPEPVLRDSAAFLDTVHPEDRERVAGQLLRPVEGERRMEYRILRPDGAVRWISARLFPVRDPQGHIHRTAGISEDVTSRKELEAQLQNARQMDAVGRLAGGVAHDLNNALATVTGLVAMLRSGPAGPAEAATYLDEIERAVRRSTALVQRLLAFGRKQVLQPRVLDLNELVLRIEPALRRSLGDRGELEFRYEARRPHVRVDPAQIEQVLVNLVLNARDALGDEGSVRVWTFDVDRLPANCVGSEREEEGCFVACSVSDTGMGIAPDALPHIFEPFFTTKAQDRGTGLGLATVYGIVEQSGGHLRVESAPGAGSTFTLFLPAADPTESRGAAGPPRRRAAGPRTGTVLLVDDEPSIVLSVGHMLRMQGYTVLEAHDGPTALRIAASHPGRIDLLLTDIMMPGMNGRELFERLTEQRPEISVLYISGHTEDEVIRDGILHAGVAFVPKPFQLDQLMDRVAEVIAAPPRFRID